MKKLIAFLLVLALMTVMLASCDLINKVFGGGEDTTTTAADGTTTQAPEETTTKKPWVPGTGTTKPKEETTTTAPNGSDGELEFPQLPI